MALLSSVNRRVRTWISFSFRGNGIFFSFPFLSFVFEIEMERKRECCWVWSVTWVSVREREKKMSKQKKRKSDGRGRRNWERFSLNNYILCWTNYVSLLQSAFLLLFGSLFLPPLALMKWVNFSHFFCLCCSCEVTI